jgi:hypothetical protein
MTNDLDELQEGHREQTKFRRDALADLDEVEIEQIEAQMLEYGKGLSAGYYDRLRIDGEHRIRGKPPTFPMVLTRFARAYTIPHDCPECGKELCITVNHTGWSRRFEVNMHCRSDPDNCRWWNRQGVRYDGVITWDFNVWNGRTDREAQEGIHFKNDKFRSWKDIKSRRARAALLELPDMYSNEEQPRPKRTRRNASKTAAKARAAVRPAPAPVPKVDGSTVAVDMAVAQDDFSAEKAAGLAQVEEIKELLKNKGDKKDD